MKKPAPPKDDPQQSKRFEDAAHELGADKDGKDFERAMDAISKKSAAPVNPPQPSPRKD